MNSLHSLFMPRATRALGGPSLRSLCTKASCTNEERLRRYVDAYGLRRATDTMTATGKRETNQVEGRRGPKYTMSLRHPPDVRGSPPSSEEIASFLQEDGGALDVVVIDVASKASFTDNLVIATGRSAAHVSALSESLVRKLKNSDVTVDGDPAGLSPCNSPDWCVVDAGFTVVHLLLEATREKYSLEELWSD